MSDVQKIENEVQKLSPEELASFREWFANFDGEIWDQQFEQDVNNGRLNKLTEEALGELREGRCTDL